jgi:EpsG family
MPIILLLITYGIYWVIGPSNFSDYENYQGLIIFLQTSFTPDQVLGEEGFSKLMIFLSSYFTNSPQEAHALIVLSIQFVFLSITIFTYFKKRTDFNSLVLPIAIFAPLITTIVIRNSFAYLFSTFAFFTFSKSRWSSLIFCLIIALLFHSSVILIIPVFILAGFSFISAKIKYYSKIWILLLTLIGFFLIFSRLSLSFITNLDFVQENLGARTAYVQDDRLIVSSFHYLWVILIGSSYWLFFERLKSPRQISFFFFGYVLYIFLLVSPVVAFRYSVFFLLPFFIVCGSYLSSLNWKSVKFISLRLGSVVLIFVFTYFNMLRPE